MTSSSSEAAHAGIEFAYRVLSGDDSDERACASIPDESCTSVPRNYVLNVANGAATKLAEQLASPGLVLPWLLSSIGVPAALTAIVMPIKQAGSLLPQLAVAGWIRSRATRKWVWVAAGTIQAIALMLIAFAAMQMPPLAAGMAIVALFAAFSMASGMGSVAFQDVMGKTVPKGRRGRLLSNRALIGGSLALAAAAALQFGPVGQAKLDLLLLLVFAAAVLWALGALAFAGIEEEPGETEGGRSMLRELRSGMQKARELRGYRKFLVARALLLGVEIAMPFYALHASQLFDRSAEIVPLFILAVAAASVVSSPFWGALSDWSSRRVMAASGAIGVISGLTALAIDVLPPDQPRLWLYAVVFAALGIAESGLRLGRKTYLTDGAPGDERPLFVAFANTSVGLLALAGVFIGILVDATSPVMGVAFTSLMAALGVAAALSLPPASRMAETH